MGTIEEHPPEKTASRSAAGEKAIHSQDSSFFIKKAEKRNALRAFLFCFKFINGLFIEYLPR